MNAEQKTHLITTLESTFNDFINTFAEFNEDDVNKIPFAGSWTPAQVAQHIILATDGVPDQKVGTTNRPFDGLIPSFEPWWTDVSNKYDSPEFLQPDRRPRPKIELLAELNRVRRKDVGIASTKDLTELCLDFELPMVGHLTRYEWLSFIEMHLRRHIFQLDNMRAKINSAN